MRRISLELDDQTVERLEARMDDSKPTLEVVARALLTGISEGVQQELGFRPCICGHLDKLSSEINSPVAFDTLVSEYHILRDTPHGKAQHVLRYCPWCGGRAPVSKRDQLFATVDHIEAGRLNALCAGIKTFNDAIDRFGPPDFDRADGMTTIKPTVEGAEEHTPHRVIFYTGLSETAEVRFTQRVGDLVSVSFTGKYIGPPLPLV